MKKISVKNLNFSDLKQLSREDLRGVIGGSNTFDPIEPCLPTGENCGPVNPPGPGGPGPQPQQCGPGEFLCAGPGYSFCADGEFILCPAS